MIHADHAGRNNLREIRLHFNGGPWCQQPDLIAG
jgi:hypothetical protein